MQPFCKTIDAKDDTRDITFARLRDQISTTVTQTPSSYERKGEGLNFARQMTGIFFRRKGKDLFFAFDNAQNVGLGKHNR